MKKWMVGAIVMLTFASAGSVLGQKDKDEGPTSWVYFSVVKDDNGKPVRSAAIILHAVDEKGRQERGDMELKTDPDGKANFDGIPLGKIRVQIIASGFQTYGEDYDITKDKTEITIKLKRPHSQYSIYDDHTSPPAKASPPPADSKKPD